ncbi:hypothetical protein [Melittangium boletus]|jgi:hypothetical protein|uniref:hypothetical protein n=1 Tax=Melittangium boletus TaxID=83453 RepID=UPI003DA65379
MRGRWSVGVVSGWLLGGCAPLQQEEGVEPPPLPEPSVPPPALCEPPPRRSGEWAAVGGR